jgi:hypothetical protein
LLGVAPALDNEALTSRALYMRGHELGDGMGRHSWACWGLLLALSTNVACGSDAKSGAASYVGEEKSMRLTAGAEGTLDVGAAALVLPEGALKEDTEISVTVKAKSGLPEAKNIALDVYDYGPDGTQFEKPVKLSFDMQGVKVPKDNKVTVAFLEGSKWTRLTTTVKDGKASAETRHFTPFTLLFVLDDEGDSQLAGQCNPDFEPCGGNLVGTWEFTGACLTAPPGALDNDGGASLFGMCDDKPMASISVELMGSAMFGKDGSFSSEQTVTIEGGYRISKVCLAQVAESMGVSSLTCAQVDGTPDGDVCVLGAGTPETSQDSTMGTYTVDGTGVTVTDADAGATDEPKASPYCVTGDQLLVRVIDSDDGKVIVYQASRK